jgi:hypothetical protein
MPRTVGSLALAGLIVGGVQTLALTQIVPGPFFIGRVVDNAGGGVPAVQVTLHRLDTTVRTTIQTNGTGHFNFQKIESGTYSVDFAEAHFRTQEYAAVHLAPEKAYDLRVTLQLGKQEEIVSGATDDDLKECVLIDLDVRDAQTLRSGTKVLVSGSLRDHGGRAIPGATLTFKAKRGTSAAPRTAISEHLGTMVYAVGHGGGVQRCHFSGGSQDNDV